MLNFGLTVEQLLIDLESAFPHCRPEPSDKMKRIMFNAGQRSVIEFIKQRLEDE